MKKNLLAFIVSCLCYMSVLSQTSYIYIEPIKGLPSRLLVNKQDWNSVSKNYFIIPCEHSGEYIIDIVFGAESYPKQRFIVDVADSSAYGFKLAKTAENKFYLMDLVNSGKIIETNTNVNIALGTLDNKINYFGYKEQKQANSSKPTSSTNSTPNASNQSTSGGIVQIITSNDTEITINKSSNPSSSTTTCKVITSDNEILNFIDKLILKSDDESKLLFLKKRVFTGCITPSQASKISEQFSTQYGRYNCVKFLFPLLSDRRDISHFEGLFRSESYKSKLKELL